MCRSIGLLLRRVPYLGQISYDKKTCPGCGVLIQEYSQKFQENYRNDHRLLHFFYFLMFCATPEDAIPKIFLVSKGLFFLLNPLMYNYPRRWSMTRLLIPVRDMIHTVYGWNFSLPRELIWFRVRPLWYRFWGPLTDYTPWPSQKINSLLSENFNQR